MEINKIKDLPLLDRPREKALYYGINKLNNSELLALIIGSGDKLHNAIDIATSLLIKAKGIKNILNLSYLDLMAISGIKKATALRFLAIKEIYKRQGTEAFPSIFINSKEVAKRYIHLIGNNNYESMFLVALNSKGETSFEKEIYIGTKQNLLSSANEIIELVKKEQLSFFLLIHNHPSKIAKPSKEDVINTNHLYIKARENQIVMLDHIIVTNQDYYSFKDNNDFLTT